MTVLLLLSCLFLSLGDNFEIQTQKRVTSTLSFSAIEHKWDDLSQWPQWFFHLSQAISQNSSLNPESILTLEMDPKKGVHKKFNLTAKVNAYQPGHKLSLEIIGDTSHRLTSLFDHLFWEMELEKKDDRTVIVGSIKASTHNWRARLFGRIAKNILLNQVFYPDLLSLSINSQPSPPAFSIY